MTFYITHNGCEPTLFDASRIKQVLTKEGFICSSEEQAHIIIFLCCTFTIQKENETNELILRYKNQHKTIIVTGCFLQKENLSGKVKYIKLKNLLPFLTHNEKIENMRDVKIPLVKISEGCTGKCSFCSIKNVKGKHCSIVPREIMQQIEFLYENYNEIKLVGQDIAAYGTDIGISLYSLLADILTTFPTIKIELGSLNPRQLKEFKKKELEILASERIIGNILIPVQSASNRILKQMQREYTIEDFQNLYNTLHNWGIRNISTDIIAGFPNETEEDHLLNLKFLSDKYFSFAEIFMYETRPNTLASKMEQIPLDIRKKRTSELIVQHINTYSKYNNTEFEYLIENEQIFNTNMVFKQ
ncbi:MAG: radical SAM protein [Bacteroidales bacterium]|jgi:tRNA A37 methylthiotransferase MiaB|nr:radical SAM protein [Bacteroidales bacterium]